MIQEFAVGRFFSNCYIVASKQTGDALIIDPGFDDSHEAEKICRFIESNSLQLRLIVNTHGHPDHTCGNGIVKRRFGVPILIHEHDAYMLQESSNEIAKIFGFQISSPPADKLLHKEDWVRAGDINLRVIHTPGHSRGSISLQGKKEVFTGDTLFAGSIGRTDFPESSSADMNLSLRELANLPVQYQVYPGHGPKTTISEEIRINPFLRFL